MNEQSTGRDPEDSLDFRLDSGPETKEEPKPKMARVTVSSDQIKKFFRWVRELFL